MAATRKQMNWSAVGFTPTGGSLATFTSVDSVSFDAGAQLLPYSGDASIFPTIIVNSMNAPKATVNATDPAEIMVLVAGTVGAFTATHNDAKLATGGAIIYALANAVIGNPTTTGQHAAFGTATLEIQAYSSDGTTNPLSFTRA